MASEGQTGMNLTTDSLPHVDVSTLDADELLLQFSANGAAGPDGAPPEDGDATQEDKPSYWHTQRYTLREFLKRPPKQWLVDKVIGVQDFVLLYGTSGEGKTHVALDLAFSCLTKSVFADTFEVARPMSVAYATGEGIGGLADRLRAVSRYYGVDTREDLPLYLFTDIPQLYTPDLTNGALAFLEAWQEAAQDGSLPATLDVLILDTLHNASAGSDENSAKDASLIQATMRRLRDVLGCAIVLVHHAGKNGGSERGSSAIRASMDTVLRSQIVGRYFTLTCEKLKDLEAWTPKGFDLVSVNDCTSVRVFWRGDSASTPVAGKNKLEARIMSYLDNNVLKRRTADEVAQAIGEESRTAVQNTLKALRQTGAILSAQEDRETRDGKVRKVYVYWREAQEEK